MSTHSRIHTMHIHSSRRVLTYTHTLTHVHTAACGPWRPAAHADPNLLGATPTPPLPGNGHLGRGSPSTAPRERLLSLQRLLISTSLAASFSDNKHQIWRNQEDTMCNGYLSPKSPMKGTKALSRFQLPAEDVYRRPGGPRTLPGAPFPSPGAPSPGPRARRVRRAPGGVGCRAGSRGLGLECKEGIGG